MVQEAEEFAEQDKAVKAKVDARNALETYCYNMKQTIEDKLGDKLDEDDKEKVPPCLQPSDNSALLSHSDGAGMLNLPFLCVLRAQNTLCGHACSDSNIHRL